jgi:hypothetical protein
MGASGRRRSIAANQITPSAGPASRKISLSRVPLQIAKKIRKSRNDVRA